MSACNDINRPHYATAQHELVEHLAGHISVRSRQQLSADQLLAYTLPYALRAEATEPMYQWLRYFVETGA